MFSLASLFGDEAAILRDSDFQALLLATVLPGLGTALMSPILDSLIDPFGATSGSIGLLVSAYAAPAIVVIPVAGALADRFGRKVVLVTAIVLFGLGGTAIAFTTDFRVVLALRALQGVGFAGMNPTIITSIGDLYAGDAEATGQGLRFTTAGLSGAVFPTVAGVLILFAWQYPFFLYALSFPIALAVALYFDEPTADATPTEPDGGRRVAYVRALARLGAHRRVSAILVARALMMAVWIGFLTYNSLVVVRLLGGTPVQAGVLATLGFVTMAGSASQAGRPAVVDRRRHVLLAANGCLGGGFVVLLVAPGLAVATVGVVLVSVGFGTLGAVYRPIITGFAPTDLRAGLVSISEAGGRVVATVTPVAMGGFIALTAPTVGFATALQLAGGTVAVVGAGGSFVCLLVAEAAPAAPAE